MSLLGLPLPQLLALFAGGSGVLFVLYLLRHRRRRIEVPFARLWQQVARQTESTTLWQRLKRWLSLLLQLFILLLIVTALGDLRLSPSDKGRTMALLVDASASMQAVDDGAQPGLTRMARAREQARRLIRGLAGDDLAVVVVLDSQPAPVGGLSGDERELLQQVDSVTARDGPADLSRALLLCGDLLAGRKNPQIVLISDGGFDDAALAAAGSSSGPASAGAAPQLRYVAVPEVDPPATTSGFAGNVAITAFSVRRYRHNRLSYEVLVELSAFPSAGTPPRPAEVTLELLQEGEVVDVQQLVIPAGTPADPIGATGPKGTRLQRLYPNLSGSGVHLEARVRLKNGRDLLPLDDHAYALLPDRRRQRVLLVTQGDLFLEGAILSAGAGEESQIQVDKLSPASYDPARAAGYDAVLFDGFTPPEPPAANALYLDPAGPGSPFEIAETVAAPYLTDVASEHPLMRWITLKDVNISKASVFRLAPGDVALAASLHKPVLVAREQRVPGGAPRRVVAVGFDLRHSDLPLRVAFPVFLVNVLDWFAGDLAADAQTYTTGHTWRIPLANSAATGRGAGPPHQPGAAPEAIDSAQRSGAPSIDSATADLTLPDGTVVPVPVQVEDQHAFYHGQRVGFYQLQKPGSPPVLLAANLSDATESAAAIRRQLRIGPAPGQLVPAPEPGRSALKRVLWPYLILLALALLCLEWWTYHRRWTV